MEKLFFTFLMLCGLNLSYGQISIGVTAGGNLTDYRDYYKYNYFKFGWNGGGYGNLKIKSDLLVQAELLYSDKNYYYFSPLFNATLKLHYINLPILFIYHPLKKLGILIGPELSYLHIAKLEQIGGPDANMKPYYPNFDKSIVAGISFDVMKKLGIKIFYDYGISTVGYRPNLGRFTNRSGQLAVYYKIK